MNVWAWYMTLDEERGILYMPVAGPAGNYWGGDRPGNNLFANSIVAVDAETGKYRWHFQTVHHDLWDSDMPNPPALVDIMQNGRRVPALASVGKTGYMFILDRVTGKPIFGVEERPVPKGNVPGEWYSPTQPFPVKPAQAARARRVQQGARHGAARRHVGASTWPSARRCGTRAAASPTPAPFTPFGFHEEGAAAEEHDPVPRRHRRRQLGRRRRRSDDRARLRQRARHVARRLDRAQAARAELRQRHRRARRMPYDRGSVNGAGPYFTFSAPLKDATGRTLANLPCQRPPWARLVAVNANTGEIAWETPLGLTEALPEGKQLTGSSGSAGPTVDGGRTGLRRRHQRSPASARSMRRPARSCGRRELDRPGQREPDDLSRQERQAVRGGGGDRLARGLRASLRPPELSRA